MVIGNTHGDFVEGIGRMSHQNASYQLWRAAARTQDALLGPHRVSMWRRVGDIVGSAGCPQSELRAPSSECRALICSGFGWRQLRRIRGLIVRINIFAD